MVQEAGDVFNQLDREIVERLHFELQARQLALVYRLVQILCNRCSIDARILKPHRMFSS